MRILAVDDDQIHRDILSLMLMKVGYNSVEFADSAETAVRKIDSAKAPFECYLLDIQMPGMNGIKL